MRTEKETQIIENLRKQNSNLKRKNFELEREMVQRGIEVTKMIRIFLVCEGLLPEGQREEFRNTALEFAARNDNSRSSYRKGIIDFREARTGDYFNGRA